MSKKAKLAREAFTFSLGGMYATTSIVFAPAVADDYLNKIRDAQSGEPLEDQPNTPDGRGGIKRRSWLRARRRAP